MTAATSSRRYVMGLAGGPSGDGIDAVLTAITAEGEGMRPRQMRHEVTPYDPSLRERILDVASGEPTTARALAEVDRDVGAAFADAAAALLRGARRKPTAVGSKGQTVVRGPLTRSEGAAAGLQLGSPAIIAERTGLPVVADFAQADLAVGGRGAPLTAWPSWLLFSDARKSRVLVRLGGIATVTFLPAAGLAADTLAFDTGPGTMVIDALARRFLDAPYDADGGAAAAAASDRTLLHELLADAYFDSRPPKTTDPRMWGRSYADRLCLRAEAMGVSAGNLIATAGELTVRSIVGAIGRLTENPHEVILCGGGAKNIYLAMRLRKLLVPASTVSIERFDIDATAWGAVCAAMLAAARLDGAPANIPQVTGASRAVMLGSVTEV